MILIDIMNQTLLSGNKEAIIQILNRPIISLEKEDKEINKNNKDFNEVFLINFTMKLWKYLKILKE